MGSPLSPVIASFFMEDFEEETMKRTINKPLCWFIYVDYMFKMWPHEQKKLDDFHRHLSSIHNNIQFTMEAETDGYMPFLDIDVYRRLDSSLGHKVYRKCTHSNLSKRHISPPSGQQTGCGLHPGSQGQGHL